jgi:hypothetical protein
LVFIFRGHALPPGLGGLRNENMKLKNSMKRTGIYW